MPFSIPPQALAREPRYRYELLRRRSRGRGVASYYTEGIGSYYAAGSPPLPGRWNARALSGLGETQPRHVPLGLPIWRQDFFDSGSSPGGITAGSYPFGDVNEFGVVTVNGVWVGDIVDGKLVQSSAQKATAEKLVAANTAAAQTFIAAGAPPPPNAQVATAGIGAGLSAWLDKSTVLLGTSVKNSYLATGAGLAALLVFGMRKKRGF